MVLSYIKSGHIYHNIIQPQNEIIFILDITGGAYLSIVQILCRTISYSEPDLGHAGQILVQGTFVSTVTPLLK